MQSLPLPARIFVLCVVLSGAAMLLLVTPSIPFDEPYPLVTSTILALAIGVVDIYRVRLPYKAEVSVSLAIAFGMVLMFGSGLACWAAAIVAYLADLHLKKPWYKASFNSANYVLPLGLAGLAYKSLSDGSGFVLSSMMNTLALFLAMAICLMVNTLAVSTIVGLVNQQSPWRVWWANHEGVLLQFLTLAPLGTLMALTYSLTPYGLGLILLFLPLGAVYYSLKSYEQLRDQTKYTIEALARAVDERDPYTAQHSERTAEYAEKIARRMYLPPNEVEAIGSAARVHDLGKIGIAERVLFKPGPLEDAERRKMQRHPVVGADIVSRLPFYQAAKDIILHHHEHYNGKGYPEGLKGEEIPLGARILGVADAFEAMTSERPYRPPLSYEEAIAELKAGKGTQFDPAVVDALLPVLKDKRLTNQLGIRCPVTS